MPPLYPAACALSQSGPDAFAATGLFANPMEQLIATGHLSGQVVESLDRIGCRAAQHLLPYPGVVCRAQGMRE